MSRPTIARVLRLLSLLQARRFWAGHDLAERLRISERTLRRDIDQLRELGYRVSSERGYDGGYSLEAGADLPPLLLDDDELVVLAVGLRAVATRGIEHTNETALSALAKFEQLLPARLQRRVSALQSHTMPAGPAGESASSAAPETIARLALASRDSERVRFGYTDVTGTRRACFVEPHCLISAEQGWYLIGWDLHAKSWEAFRVDRLDSYVATGTRFVPKELDARRATEIASAAAAR